jgi:hypothetical protein
LHLPSSAPPAVTVIVPTQAQPARDRLLQRAIMSVLSQEGVDAVPLVVVNGNMAGSQTVRTWCSDRHVAVAEIEEADLPAALRAGRRLVDTPFFAELDDDDELSADALATRVRALTGDPHADVVVTNGLRRTSVGDSLHVTDMEFVRNDPLRALLSHNWLLPGSWLCRTDRVGDDIFDRMPRYRECTYLALIFSTRYRMIFVNEPTVVYHADTMPSESKSREYILGSLAAEQMLLTLDLPLDVREQFRRKYLASAYRSIARVHVGEHRLFAAMHAYLRSCLQPGGLQYLLKRLFLRPPSA